MNNDRLPFSRPTSIEGIASKGSTFTVEATPAECRRLAEDMDIVAVDSLVGTFTLTPWRRNGVKVEGEVTAHVKQACVVTLDPVDEVVREPVLMTFLPGAEVVEPTGDVAIDPDAMDPPEPLIGHTVDLGVIAAEHAALGLDPYPRKPGATFEPHIEDDGSEDEPASPFARLTVIKGGDGA